MPLPRVRFTVRRMMVAVAVAAVIVAGSIVLWRRAGEFRVLASFHARRANEPVTPIGPVATRLVRERKVYHTAMAGKYDRAARYPFLPVAPTRPSPSEALDGRTLAS